MCGMLRTTPRKRWPMLRIIEHLTYYRSNPQAPCDPPSDYSDDEDLQKEELKSMASKKRNSIIEKAPKLLPEEPDKTPIKRRSTVILDPTQESPSYM